MSRARKLLSFVGEANSTGELVQALIDTKDSKENEDQGKFVQLLKGLAFSDDPKSDEFMVKLMKMINDSNFGEFLEK